MHSPKVLRRLMRSLLSCQGESYGRPSGAGMQGERAYSTLAAGTLEIIEFKTLYATLADFETACWLSSGICAFISEAPPSTSINWPVIHPASSEQRSATAFPMSAGVPSRRIGVHPSCCHFLMVFCTGSGRVLSTLSSVHPGLIVFTVMPRAASATAK